MTIGDRVRLKADWSLRGRIVDEDGSEAGSAYVVQWDNGVVTGWFEPDLLEKIEG